MLGRDILLAGRVGRAVPRVRAGMPFLTFGSGDVVRLSLAATQLVKSVTFRKCEKRYRGLYEAKYKMVMGVLVTEILPGAHLSVSLDLSDLTSGLP